MTCKSVVPVSSTLCSWRSARSSALRPSLLAASFCTVRLEPICAYVSLISDCREMIASADSASFCTVPDGATSKVDEALYSGCCAKVSPMVAATVRMKTGSTSHQRLTMMWKSVRISNVWSLEAANEDHSASLGRRRIGAAAYLADAVWGSDSGTMRSGVMTLRSVPSRPTGCEPSRADRAAASRILTVRRPEEPSAVGVPP